MVGRSSMRNRSSLLAQACPQDKCQSLQDDRMRHLGFPATPVPENDRRFDHLEPLHHHSIRQLDLKGVAMRLDCIQINAFEHPTTITAKSAGTVMDRNAQDQASEDVPAPTDDLPLPTSLSRAKRCQVRRAPIYRGQ